MLMGGASSNVIRESPVVVSTTYNRGGTILGLLLRCCGSPIFGMSDFLRGSQPFCRTCIFVLAICITCVRINISIIWTFSAFLEFLIEKVQIRQLTRADSTRACDVVLSLIWSPK